MMKTPEEIKKSMQDGIDNAFTIYDDDNGYPGDVSVCSISPEELGESLAYIQQLEAELEEEKTHHQHTLECAQQFEEDWLQMKRERDAAITDLNRAHACSVCKYSNDGDTFMCFYCSEGLDFKWRGVQENGGAAHGA